MGGVFSGVLRITHHLGSTFHTKVCHSYPMQTQERQSQQAHPHSWTHRWVWHPPVLKHYKLLKHNYPSNKKQNGGSGCCNQCQSPRLIWLLTLQRKLVPVGGGSVTRFPSKDFTVILRNAFNYRVNSASCFLVAGTFQVIPLRAFPMLK